MFLVFVELGSRVPRPPKEIEEYDEEPSTLQKLLYSYLALILLQAEFSAVLYRTNSDKQRIVRRLMIATKLKNNSPSFFVSAACNSDDDLHSLDRDDGGIKDIP
jgi:hypothetical protein